MTSLIAFLFGSCFKFGFPFPFFVSMCCIKWLLFHVPKCSLFCTPAPLASSCTSMQCRNSNLMLGNFSAQPSSGGCSVSSCSYSGFVNGTIMTTWVDNASPACARYLVWSIDLLRFCLCSLSTSLQPQCPGKCGCPYWFYKFVVSLFKHVNIFATRILKYLWALEVGDLLLVYVIYLCF